MNIRKRLINLRCWWFGCEPKHYATCKECCDECGDEDENETSLCKHCGSEYGFKNNYIGENFFFNRRHDRFMWFFRYWFFRKWWPRKCRCCGNRYGNHDECLPF